MRARNGEKHFFLVFHPSLLRKNYSSPFFISLKISNVTPTIQQAPHFALEKKEKCIIIDNAFHSNPCFARRFLQHDVMVWVDEGCTSQVFLLFFLNLLLFTLSLILLLPNVTNETNAKAKTLDRIITHSTFFPGIRASCDFFSVFHRWWCDIIIIC